MNKGRKCTRQEDMCMHETVRVLQVKELVRGCSVHEDGNVHKLVRKKRQPTFIK